VSSDSDPPASRRAGDDLVQFGRRRPPRQWPARLPTALAAAAALIVAGISVALLVTIAGHPRQPPNRAVTDVGHRLLGVRADWELYARGPGLVVRVELARGRVIRTTVPFLQSTGLVSFVAGAGQVIIRPMDNVPGYVVQDGVPARPLPAALDRDGIVEPGPHPGELWIQTERGNRTVMSLVQRDGTSAGASIPMPRGAPWPLGPDGRGYLIVRAGRDTGDATPRGLRFLTTGMITAVGPGRWLAAQCHGRHCAEVVIDPASGARRVISRSRPVLAWEARTAIGQPGVISPDGSIAAVFEAGPTRYTAVLHLIDLRTGGDRSAGVTADLGSLTSQTAAWSPDGRWLFVAARGKLAVVNPRTGRAGSLGAVLPTIYQVAIGSEPVRALGVGSGDPTQASARTQVPQRCCLHASRGQSHAPPVAPVA
jgi:hypothetical protein